jgi:methylated-DNA-[protein]-cysteine S-methyltransferase
MSEPAQIYDAVLKAPFGLVGVRMRGQALAAVELRPRAGKARAPSSAAAGKAVAALQAYLDDPRAAPSLDLDLRGTPFQQRVWRALQRIPAGKTLSYGALAKKLGTSARAVGGACRSNPVPIVVPCHRVVAADGAGGFMGATRGRAMDIKTWLLGHEARISCREPR